jgi:hypothetical protein
MILFWISFQYWILEIQYAYTLCHMNELSKLLYLYIWPIPYYFHTENIILYFMQSVSITTKVVNLNSAHCEVYSIQHYVIKFVSDLLQVSGKILVFYNISFDGKNWNTTTSLICFFLALNVIWWNIINQ